MKITHYIIQIDKNKKEAEINQNKTQTKTNTKNKVRPNGRQRTYTKEEQNKLFDNLDNIKLQSIIKEIEYKTKKENTKNLKGNRLKKILVSNF